MHAPPAASFMLTSVLVIFNSSFLLAAIEAPLSVEQIRFFENRIRPILVTRCYECHSRESNEAEVGLTLDTPDGLIRGGNGGPIVVPGQPSASGLTDVHGKVVHDILA